MVSMAQCVGQLGFEALGTSSNPRIYLYFVTLLLWFWIFTIVFLILPSKLFFQLTFSRYFLTQKADIWKYFVFFLLILFFRSQRILYFFVKLFCPGIIFSEAWSGSLCQAQASTRKYRKIPSTKFSVLWDKTTYA